MNCMGRVLLESNADPLEMLWSVFGKTTNPDGFHHVHALQVANNEGIEKAMEFMEH